jgi:hypothetical protein
MSLDREQPGAQRSVNLPLCLGRQRPKDGLLHQIIRRAVVTA